MLLANLDGSIGGAQRQADALAEELARRGLHVRVVQQSPLRVTRRRAGGPGRDGVNRIRLPILAGAARWSFLLSFLVWAVTNRRRFDVIHAHGTSAGLTAGLVGSLLRKAVVVKVTGMESVTALAGRPLARQLRRFTLNTTADAVVAVSAEMMDALAAAGVGGGRCVLLPNGVALAPPSERPAALRAALVGPDRGPVVLYVGRLAEVKGTRRLLAAWAARPRRHQEVLLLVGDGPLRPELERVAGEHLNGSVRFLGAQPDPTPFYAMADVFVLPSLSEGLSNALLEAMAAGLPVVASDVGGNRAVIEHGVTGFLVDWNDADAVDRLLNRLMDDAPLRDRVGEAARRRARSYSIAAVADRYCELYRRLVAQSDRARPVVR